MRALWESGCPCAGVGSWGRFALRFPPSTGSGQAQDERTGWGQVRQGARGTGWGGWRGWVRVGAKDFSPLHGWVRWVLRVPWLLEGAGGSRFRRALLVSGCPCAGVGSWGRFALRFPPSTGSGQAQDERTGWGQGWAMGRPGPGYVMVFVRGGPSTGSGQALREPQGERKIRGGGGGGGGGRNYPILTFPFVNLRTGPS